MIKAPVDDASHGIRSRTGCAALPDCHRKKVVSRGKGLPHSDDDGKEAQDFFAIHRRGFIRLVIRNPIAQSPVLSRTPLCTSSILDIRVDYCDDWQAMRSAMNKAAQLRLIQGEF
jgi:hypothetical protein